MCVRRAQGEREKRVREYENESPAPRMPGILLSPQPPDKKKKKIVTRHGLSFYAYWYTSEH